MVVADHVLVTGPSRGGKSEWAEQRINQLAVSHSVTYLATGPLLPDDANWQARLERHRRRRPASWTLLEASDAVAVAEALGPHGRLAGQLVLLDSLGGIVAAALEHNNAVWLEQQQLLLERLAQHPLPVVLVAEEVGWGVVPATAIGGVFRDRNGSLTRNCERLCRESWLVAAGRALPLHQLAERVAELN